MTIIDGTTAMRRAPMSSLRKSALVAGVIYLVTFISIPRVTRRVDSLLERLVPA